MNSDFAHLKHLLSEIADLNKIAMLLSWDERTMLPPQGGPARAEQRASLARVISDKSTSAELGRLLDKLQAYAESLPYESDEASLVRVARRDFEKLRRVPGELRVRMTRAGALASQNWIVARKEKDFGRFLPYLAENVALKQEYIHCYAPYDAPYDVLLDDFEQGLKTAQVQAIFDELKRDLVPLIEAVTARADTISTDCLHGSFPVEQQRVFILSILERFGFTPEAWRLDATVHPFATSFAPTDIRITTRYNPEFINAALFGSMHECGHGLYENGVSPSLLRTSLSRGASLGLHESQSRMWENLVGRSRPFWTFFYPRLQQAFPQAFQSVPLEDFYRAINKMQPSFIRVEADEATYNLHIILRFELEQELFSGALRPQDLPDAWNARMESYLGITPPDDAQGVLQDIHWSSGQFGYFPTYSLGNIIACQIWEKVQAALPDLTGQIAQGQFSPLREWLRENLHQYGRKFTPPETLQKVVGGPIRVEPYVQYLKAKAQDIYGL